MQRDYRGSPFEAAWAEPAPPRGLIAFVCALTMGAIGAGVSRGQIAITQASSNCIIQRPAHAGGVAAADGSDGNDTPVALVAQPVLYLNFEGATVDVMPTNFARFDADGIVIIPSFEESLARAYPALDPARVRQEIVDRVRFEYEPFDVYITDIRGAAAVVGSGRFETLFVGGDVEIFDRPGGITTDTIGIAELDPDNVDAESIGFILVENFSRHLSNMDLVGTLMGVVAAHEFGHESGLAHIENEEARMFLRVGLNRPELAKTWLCGLADGAFDAYQDSNLWLGRNTGLRNAPFPSDRTPDDLADNQYRADLAPPIDDPTALGPVVVHGNIGEPGDVDVIRFTVSQAATVTVKLRPSDLLNGVLALLTADATMRSGKRASGAGRSVTLTIGATPDQDYYVYVNGRNGTSLGEYDLQICTSAQPAPRVVSAVVNRGDGERSVVNRLEVRFEPDVEVDLSEIELTHLGISAPDDPDSPVDLTSAIIAYSPVDRTLTLEFVPSLADGFYELRLASAGFVNCGGTMLDGDGDGVAGPDYTFGFHRFAGDFDGDADVDLADYLAFQSCFDKGAAASQMPCGSADLDFDGDIDLSDHIRMLTAFTGSAPHPGPGL